MKWIIAALLAATLCGCSVVTSTRPIGLAPLDLTSHTGDWTGTWRSPVGPCTITVMDATNGALAMTSTKPQGWWRWSNEMQHVYLRTAGDWTYASVDYSESTNACFLWGKVENAGEYIVWWTPDPDKFKPMVESGTLPGSIKKTPIEKKKPAPEPGFPIIGYTPSGEPVYETGVPGGPSEPFTWKLQVPTPEFPPSTEDEGAFGKDPHATCDDQAARKAVSDLLTSDEITLGNLDPAHYELITATSNGVMFYWDAPLVLVKVSARTDLRYLRTVQKRWMRVQGK